MNLPTLYKKTSTGAIQQWSIKALNGVITTTYGQVDGQLQTTTDTINIGKNIGKANETTPSKQAELEAIAKWQGKKKKGYIEHIDSAEKGHVDTGVIAGGVSPMLAQKFRDHAEKISYPAYVQRKYDGARCIAVIVNGKATLWTRTQKPIKSMAHIVQSLEKAFAGKTITLDGELYLHSLHKDFEQLMHLVRPDKPAMGGNVIEYHIYDMVSHEPFSRREIMLEHIADVVTKMPGEKLVVAETHIVESAEEVTKYTEQFLSEGYEGAIVRQAKTPYEIGKRSYGLQKVKEFTDSEFPITGVEEGRGRMAGCAIFICKTKDNKPFRVKMEGSLEDLKKYLTNPKLWQGKALTVKYQNLTKDGIPRFPIGKAVRDYE